MQQSSLAPGASALTHPSIRRDIALIGVVTVVSAFLAAHFELNERVFSFTRRYETCNSTNGPSSCSCLRCA